MDNNKLLSDIHYILLQKEDILFVETDNKDRTITIYPDCTKNHLIMSDYISEYKETYYFNFFGRKFVMIDYEDKYESFFLKLKEVS